MLKIKPQDLFGVRQEDI